MSRRLLLSLCCAVFTALAGSPAAQATIGVESFGFSINEAPLAGAAPGSLGPPAVQAGSHPYELTTSFQLTEKTTPGGETTPSGALRDLQVELPPGMIGSTNGIPKCPQELLERSSLSGEACPANTQVGKLTLEITGLALTFPIFNLETPPGVTARFGTIAVFVPVTMDVSVRPGDYGLTVNMRELADLLPLKSGSMTLWGVPADARHDTERGSCLGPEGGSSGSCPSGDPPAPLLTLGSSCNEIPQAHIVVDSWEEPGVFASLAATNHDGVGDSVGLTGCDKLDFRPTITVQSNTSAADSPTALSIDLRMPQSESAGGLVEAALKDAVMTLPPGVSIDPSAADGLAACTPQEIGMGASAEPSCPDASKVGVVEIATPLLTGALQGSIYLAQPEVGASGEFAVYIVAAGDGIQVKLEARLHADLNTGQLSLSLLNAPQLPVSDFRLSFNGGPRAPLATPNTCGSLGLNAQLTPYSASEAGPAVTTSSSFGIDHGCRTGFSPSFLAGATSAQAGQGTGFTLQLARADGEQLIQSLSAVLPPGLLANLGSVSLCAAAQAAQGSCGAASQIGSVTVAAGSGTDPFYLRGGRVFLTGPYGGAPFGLSISIPAVAGPFDLGSVVLRARLAVDPVDAHLTITTDQLPTILGGVPLRVRALYMNVERTGFMFNPTSCHANSISASVAGSEGALATVSSPFGLSGCAGLPFAPRLSASTEARVTRAGGAGLALALTEPPGVHANLRAIDVGLPNGLAPRLTAIQDACLQSVFKADPASCPAGSIVGSATALTPILGVALHSPVYMVSSSGRDLPYLAVVLQGEGVTLRLTGALSISQKGAMAVHFAAMPDAPITSFDLNLPRGRHSALGASFLAGVSGTLCGRKLSMSTTLTAQNGAQLRRALPVAVAGCSSKRVKVKKTHVTRRSR